MSHETITFVRLLLTGLALLVPFVLLLRAIRLWIQSVFLLRTYRLRSLDKSFVDFCKRKPILIALRCPPSQAFFVGKKLVELIGRRRELFNPYGQAPWRQHLIRVEVRCDSEGLVTLRATGCTPSRHDRAYPDPIGMLHRLGSLFDIEDVWLHGQMRNSSHFYLDRDRMSWNGYYDEKGHLHIHPDKHHVPSWLQDRSPPLYHPLSLSRHSLYPPPDRAKC